MVRVLGRGVYGTVFSVKGLALKRTRVYNPQEIMSMIKLKSLPFVPRIHSYGRKWFTMNKLPPGTKKWSVWSRTASAANKKKALAQLKRNVAAIHRKGISHGDLHTDNVLVNRTGKVWIVDYGQSQTIPRGEKAKYTPGKYVFHWVDGVPTYSFSGILSRKNSNMLKLFGKGRHSVPLPKSRPL